MSEATTTTEAPAARGNLDDATLDELEAQLRAKGLEIPEREPEPEAESAPATPAAPAAPAPAGSDKPAAPPSPSPPAAPAAAAPEDTPTAEDLAGTESLKGSERQAVIQDRIRRRRANAETLRRENEELRQKLAAAERAGAPAGGNGRPAAAAGPGAPGSPAPAPTQAEVENALVWLGRAETVLKGGEADGIKDVEVAGKYRQTALRILARVQDPGMLEAADAAAREGRFGTDGDAVAAAAARELPLARARREAAEKAAAQHNEQLVHYAAAWNESFDKAVARYPALAERGADGKPESAEHRFGMEWWDRNVGTKDKPGPLFLVQLDPRNLDLVLDLMMSQWRAQRAAKLEEDLTALKRRLTPGAVTGGGPAGTGEPAPDSSDGILAQLRERHPEVRFR